MSASNANNGRVVVRVRDQVNRSLAGHGGRQYTSPLHDRADALTLVALLLGRKPETNDDGHEQSSWSCPLAGGQRTITLDPAPGPAATGRRPKPVMTIPAASAHPPGR